jgi:small conductance mechanosensitive channel
VSNLLDPIEAAVAVIVIVAAGLSLSGWTARRLVRRGAPPASVRWTRIGITVVALLVAALVSLVLIGPINLATGLTFSAIVGLAVSLALQTTLSNIIAGFILLQDRTLRMNDVVTISGVTGRVVRVGLVLAWVRLDDGRLATVSNSTLLAGPMINKSAEERLKGEY